MKAVRVELLILIAFVLAGGALTYAFISAASQPPVKEPEPVPIQRGTGPDVSHCFEGSQPLWDCIRYVEDSES